MKISGNGIEINRISLPRLAWLTIALVMFWHLCYNTTNADSRGKVIMSDGAGYYAYLPAIFIYHDYEYKFTKPGPEKINYIAADYGLFMNITPEGKHINKYFIGTAVLELPFFLIAYGTAPMFGHAPDGYTFPFQMAIAIAAIFYALLGLEQLRRLLHRMGISEPIQAITLLLIFFGTNLYHYAMNESSMSHVYSFGMVALFLNQAHRVLHEQNRRAIFWSIVALTMVIFLRPVNGIIIASLPFLAGSWQKFKDGLRFVFAQKTLVLAGAAVFCVMLFIQLLMYKLCTGKWINYSYSGETLDITNVHFANVLFSWRKGWFIYTPLMLFAVGGIFCLPNRFSRWSFFGVLMLILWITASWQCWWYGGCFGMRPLIDYYPLMAIPFAWMCAFLFDKWKVLIAIPVFAFVTILNLVQIYQFEWGILPYDEMNYAIYRKIFFRTDPAWMCLYIPTFKRDHTLPEGSTLISSRTQTFEPDTSLPTARCLTTENVFAGKYAIKLDTANLIEIMCLKAEDFVPENVRPKTWLVIRSKVFLTSEKMNVRMGVTFRSAGTEYYTDYPPLFPFVESHGKWQDFSYALRFPIPPGPDVEICCFLAHDFSTVTYADDVTLEFYTEP